jgi:hypothetical protein
MQTHSKLHPTDKQMPFNQINEIQTTVEWGVRRKKMGKKTDPQKARKKIVS